MSNFIIDPNQQENYSGCWDNAFLWKERNVYIMASHRLALWCWLQVENILGKEYSLIHIDEHTDARKWEGPGEQECLKDILSNFPDLSNFDVYESFQCPCRDTWMGRSTRPCITYDNFVHLAAQANLFRHFYIYSSIGDWHTGLHQGAYHFNTKMKSIFNLVEDIKKSNGKCIIDIDLDFFDDRDGFPKKVSEDELLKFVFNLIAKHMSEISMITISLNDTPGSPYWDKRQHQLSIIKEILNLDVPIPIMII